MSPLSSALLQWRSAQGRRVVEWVPDAHSESPLDAAARLVDSSAGTAFLIVRLDRLHGEDLSRLIDAVCRSSAPPKMCLAGSRDDLGNLDHEAIDPDQVGLLLDEVTETTPVSDIIWDRIEAMRFQADFVARAANNLRVGCALECMLSLAREMGLCTLGSNPIPGGATVTGHTNFDYLFEPRLKEAFIVSAGPAPGKAAPPALAAPPVQSRRRPAATSSPPVR